MKPKCQGQIQNAEFSFSMSYSDMKHKKSRIYCDSKFRKLSFFLEK